MAYQQQSGGPTQGRVPPEKPMPKQQDGRGGGKRSDAGDGDADGHIGATEDQVSDTPAPSGKSFDDEPKQG